MGAWAPAGEDVAMLGRISAQSTLIVVSFVLASIGAVVTGVTAPGVLNVMQDVADDLEQLLTQTPLPDKYNVWVRFIVDDSSLTLMFFTIIVRILIAIGGGLVGYAVAAATKRSGPAPT